MFIYLYHCIKTKIQEENGYIKKRGEGAGRRRKRGNMKGFSGPGL